MKFNKKAMAPLPGGNVIVPESEWDGLIAAHNDACEEIESLKRRVASLSEQLKLKSEEIKTLAKIVKEIYTDET